MSALQVSKDKLCVQYIGKGTHNNDVGAIQADCPAPSDCLLYYYEMTVSDAGERGVIAVGFADLHFRLSRQPGWEPNSYGYHGDDGNKFHNSGKGEDYGPGYGQGDVIGAGIHIENQEIFFTKNGKKLGTAFQNVKGTLYPTIGLHSQNEKVELNFGSRPFQFDVEGMIAEEREQRAAAIRQLEIPTSAPHNIVRSYLRHYGYADTLAVFDEKYFREEEGAGPSSADGPSSEDAGKKFTLQERKRIRSLLFEGNVDEVCTLLAHKDCISKGSQVHFVLEIQKFIELIREQKIPEAVEHARTSLSDFRGQQAEALQEVLALLAYKDPMESPMAYLMGHNQREAVADIINAAMLSAGSLGGTKDNLKSVLEKLLLQLCRVQAEIRIRNDNKGEIFKLNHILD